MKLQEEGIEPFLDKWHLIPGDPWQEALEVASRREPHLRRLPRVPGIWTWQREEMRSALDTRVSNR